MPWVTVNSPTSYQRFAPDAAIEVTGAAGDLNGGTVTQVDVDVVDTYTNKNQGGASQVAKNFGPGGTWSVVVPALPVGSYWFTVGAENSDGRFTKPALRIDVEVPDPDATGPSYSSLVFSRAQWSSGDEAEDGTCSTYPGSATLGQVAADLKSLGLSATLDVIPAWESQNQRKCLLYGTIADWSDIATLAAQNGFSVINGGATRLDLIGLPPAQQKFEACSGLPTLAAQGYPEAWSLFGAAEGAANAEVSEVAGTCNSFTRNYNGGWDYRPRTLAGPDELQVNSYLGGPCNDPQAACYYNVTGPRRYTDPETITAALQPSADSWGIVQLYRFVSGSQLSGQQTWDCTSPDWREHWTYSPINGDHNTGELYCVNDLISALAALPAGLRFSDPAVVAQAWGRVPQASAPATVDLGAVPFGSSATHAVTVTDTGPIAISMLGARLAMGTPFTITSDDCSGTMVAAAASCTVTVKYTPSSPTSTNHDTLILTDTAPDHTQEVVLSGSGSPS
jgi:hypothetical protein